MVTYDIVFLINKHMQHLYDLSLNEILGYELPSKTLQKRLWFRPSIDEVVYTYDLLNYTIFDSQLVRPRIVLAQRCRKYWGMCFGEIRKQPRRDTFCHIRMQDKWYSPQWLVMILAHEMAHQYQWDIVSIDRKENGKDALMSHGPSFFLHRNRLAEHYIPLKTSYSSRKWFKTQDIMKL